MKCDLSRSLWVGFDGAKQKLQKYFLRNNVTLSLSFQGDTETKFMIPSETPHTTSY